MELKFTTKPDSINVDVGDLYLDESGREVVLNEMGGEVEQRLVARLNYFPR